MEKLPIRLNNNQNEQGYQKYKIKVSIVKLLKSFGPGLLISMAYLDPGNLAGDIDAGITAQYKLLWALLYSTLLGWVFQNYAMILGIVTGKDMAQLCRQHYGNKSKYLLWIMAEIAIIGSDIQEVLGSAFAINLIFNLPIWTGVLITILNTLIILLIKQRGMKKLEIILGVLIFIMMVCFFINLVQIEPNLLQTLEGIAIPQIPEGSKIALIGLIGAVLMPHNLYLHSSIVNEQEKKVDNSDHFLVQEAIAYGKIETGISLLLSFFLNLSVICTFSHFSGKQDLNLLTAGDALKNSFGKNAEIIWGIGLLAAGQSSTLTGTLSGQYIMEGFVEIKLSKFKRALITRCIAIIPAILISFLDDMTEFNNYLNALQAIQLPFAVIPMLKFCYSQQIMGKYKMGKKSLILLISSSVLIVSMNYYTTFPSFISFDFKDPFTIVFLIGGSFYFLFMIIVIQYKFKNNQNHRQFELEDIMDSIEDVQKTDGVVIEEIQFHQQINENQQEQDDTQQNQDNQIQNEEDDENNYNNNQQN